MTGRALVVQHVLFEDLGLLGPVLERRGYALDVREAGVDDLVQVGDPDLVVVLGGPIGVGDVARYPWLADEIRLLRHCVERAVPVLGVCLGAQLLAAAMGAAVIPSGRVEIGFAPLQLTEAGRRGPLALLDDVPVLHWHGDRFEMPEGARRLAATPGFPDQAFAAGARVLGLQFHLEVNLAVFERWLVGHAHELAAHGIDPAALRRQAQASGPRLAAAGTDVFDAWLDGIARADAEVAGRLAGSR